MKDWRIEDLNDFLKVVDNIDTPFKFYEEKDEKMVKASVWLRTALISWEGESGTDRIDELKEHDFKKATELETRKIMLEDLM
jgi:hypothetical protein